jgi:UDP-glucose 4-epimerase
VAQRALVTGAYGFVGRHVARALANQGFEVIAIGHGTWAEEEWRDWGISRWYAADVTIETLFRYAAKPDKIFHCAGSGSVGHSISNPYQDYQRTVETSHAILEYMRTVGHPCSLVLPSSAAVYGIASKQPISSDCELLPVSPYGVHKKIAEDLCRLYGRHFGIRYAVVRLFSIYGLGLRKQLLWDACARLSQGDATFSGTGAETRDLLHVDDAAALLIVAAEHASHDFSAANGGTGEATAIRDIVNTIAEELPGSPRPQFSGMARPGDPQHYQADVTEAREWGWQPQHAWQDGVRSYARWFQDGAR